MTYGNPTRPPRKQSDVDIARGSPESFLRRYERLARNLLRAGPSAIQKFLQYLVDRSGDDRNLWCAYHHLASEGGQAPGPNGLTYEMLTDPEIWALMRTLRDDIRSGTYRPGPTKTVRISKGPGKGTRTIQLANIEDRVVQRAVAQIVQPLVDPFFDAFSFGARPHRSDWQAKATARHLTNVEGRAMWIVEDIRDAFDNVPQKRLLEVLRSRLPADDFQQLVERMIVTGTGRGIPQGSALSPLLLNVYLNHFLDRPWRRAGRSPMLRYIDDMAVVLPSGDQEGAKETYKDLDQQLKSAGMPVKGSAAASIHDLAAGETVEWLGFRVSMRDGKVRYDLPIEPDRAGWADDLCLRLRMCHAEPAAPQRAVQVVMGMLDQAGPAYRHTPRETLLRWIVDVAGGLDFHELPSVKAMEAQWERGWQRWRKCVGRVAQNFSAST
ncbi:MAG: reverse transcriptase domain-containing protein [Pirellulaceae bacterium]